MPMRPHNAQLIAGLNEAIAMVHAHDGDGIDVPGGFFVLDNVPWLAGPAALMSRPTHRETALPFGSRTKGRRP